MFRTNDIERMRIGADGNVGIGIDDPERRLDVDGDIQLTGDIIFKGYEDFQDPQYRFIMVDKTGKTKSLKKGLMDVYTSLEDCFDLMESISLPGESGIITIAAGTYPDWAKRIQGSKSILYTGSDCPAWVGIGTDLPEARLDVRGDAHFSEGLRIGNEGVVNSGLYIENRIWHGHDLIFDELILVKDHENKKLLQLNNDGLLRAREIKVDENNWADYVFHNDYELMPLNKVKSFIDENGHLPKVPSAAEIKKEGLNLGDAAKTSMEKIEELTLYMIDLDEKLTNQESTIELQQKLLDEQQKLLDEQKETNRLQQNLIEELKQLTNKK
jgi:hypothetical protein